MKGKIKSPGRVVSRWRGVRNAQPAQPAAQRCRVLASRPHGARGVEERVGSSLLRVLRQCWLGGTD